MASKGVKFKDASGNAVYPCPYYPVGSIYLSVNNINPSQFFGGTWVAFATGRTLVGVDTTQTEFNTVEKTGGEKTHKLTINEMPAHTHKVGSNNLCVASGNNERKPQPVDGGQDNTTSTGGGQAHNNLQPYITVYMWKRTA